MLVPVILSGGIGSRLWPLSREHYPKQFIPLTDQHHSFLQKTLLRLNQFDQIQAPIVVCNDEHRFLLMDQMQGIGCEPAAVLLEPEGRNTAPAVALAALEAMEAGQDPLLLVLPADHVINEEALFCATVQQGIPYAEQDKLVTFGIVPTAPETGYGYICRGSEVESQQIYEVAHFVEKPDVSTAERYLASGDYYWNSGIFLFKASTYLRELKKHATGIHELCSAAHQELFLDLVFKRVPRQIFTDCISDSIDYAVMEHTDQSVVVPLAVTWNDVGAWSSLWDVTPHDDDGNFVHGDVLLEGVQNCYIRGESRLITAIGLQNQVVVETPDAILIADKSQVQDVKHIVERLYQAERTEAVDHIRVYRPWGWFETLVQGERFQVKRIMVKPGAQLSLQLHHHRAEHWTVVRGTAQVVNGDETFLLSEDQSTYIPIGNQHRMENAGLLPLEVIEVQTGSYLGEDDIVRIDDQYGRGKNDL